MDIKKIILEEINDFEWAKDYITDFEIVEGIYFIVDSYPGGELSNDSELRYLFNVISIGNDSVSMMSPYDFESAVATEEFLQDFEAEGEDIDSVNFEYGDEIELDVALELIEQGYWRPWSDRT